MKKDIPEELVVEILSRVPAASLARFRLTSKGWNALIKDASFLKKHSANGPSQPLEILLIDGRVYSLSVDLRGIHDNVAPTTKVTGRFSLKDPIFDSSEQDNRLVACNPCSGETKWIKPRTCFKPFLCSRMGFFKTDFEVYDFSSGSWPSYGFGWANPPCRGRGIHVKGLAYWFALSINGESAVLHSYDFSTEWFRDLSLPSGDPRLYAHVALSATRDEQRLCLLSRRGDDALETDLWIATRAESTEDLSWSKYLSWTKFLTLSGTDLRYQCRFRNKMSFLVDQEKKVVLSCNRPRVSENIIHIVGEDKYIEVDHQGAKPTQRAPLPILLSYVPSFVPIQSSS
ncbi:hypothetical protein EUTSA_v10006371mg [Eutrema salsugineum]|uniref:F-box domain-containing protein n=1 Tax=Eutrema salsugineum TaxID=72664 RepID=V4LVK9_EUTSA|nr:hypothetical protein EUTSA_v10006371mg [Eutrema salsugineum]